MKRRWMVRPGIGMLVCVLLWRLTAPAVATEVAQFGGTYNGWPSSWTTLGGVNDASDGLQRPWVDFVGDAGNAGGFWAANSEYFYVRVRVDASTVTSSTFSDTLLVMIDQVGYNRYQTGYPDYAFAWDTNGNTKQQGEHGLEMMHIQIQPTPGSTWGAIRFDDVDGNNAKKGTQDFNGVSSTERSGDGYVRTVDGQPGFDGSAFVDFAIKWSYLKNNSTTSLEPGQTWRVAFASIANATDHNPIGDDMSAASTPTMIVTTSGWSDPITVPEPSTVMLVLSGGIALFVRLRRRRA